MINRISGLAQKRRPAPPRRPAAPAPLITASDVAKLVRSAEECISKYPAAALAASFFAGVAVAWWIKRK